VGDRLDAVLPLTAADAPRAQILFASLDTFFEPLATCHVVAPDRDVPALRSQVPRDRYLVVPESEVISEIRYFWTTARLRAKLHLVGPPVHGWYVQQLVKLAAARRVSTPFYLTLDADVICVRPTAYEDLVRGERAVAQSAPPNHPEWNDDAERVLGLPRSARQFAVTPSVFSTEAVRALARHLAQRVDPRLRRLASRLPHGRTRDVLESWRSFLIRNLPWTEYALYYTFVEQTGLFDAHHLHGGDDAIYGNSVWIESDFDDWAPAPDFPFSVVQSATRISPDRVWEKVYPYLAAARSETNRSTAFSSGSSSVPRSLPSAL
jgi:Family of unknown function (DUF6492)